MDKKEKRLKLLQLDHLVNTGGNKKDIQALRAELGMKENTSLSSDADEIERLARYYTRLYAFGMKDSEIQFVLQIGYIKLKDIKELLTVEGIREAATRYGKHDVITNYHRQKRERRRNI